LAVTALHRSRFGEFELGGLAPGEWRLLEPRSGSAG
jgi:16S rRNA U516 pseudouridylate synthase RsuA-like enzyme